MGLYDSIAGTADHLAGSTDEAFARSFDDTEGGGLYDGTAGVLDHAAGSTDEAVGRFHDGSTQIANSEWSGTQRFVGYTRLATRHFLGPIGEDAEDFAFENQAGGFMGNEDDTDLAGPSVGGSTEPGERGWEFEWRDPRAEDNDPTHPSNHPNWLKWMTANPEKVAAFVVALVTLYLLKPVLEIGANLSEA